MFRFLPDNDSPDTGWTASPRARLFLEQEDRLLGELLPRLTGYRCVQIGGLAPERHVLAQAATLCQWRIGLSDTPGAQVRCDGRHLPLASHSVDAVVLTHALEQVAEPHVLLRECVRVLSDRGQLIVLVFNPLSLGSWRRHWPTRGAPRSAACSAPPGADRLCDWLRVLECQPVEIWRYGLGFPLYGRRWRVGHRPRWLRAIGWSAQAYAVVARPLVVPRTPLASRRTRQRKHAVAIARGCANWVESER